MLFVALAGCRDNAPELSLIKKSVKKVGFVSLFRNQFSGVYTGLTVFDNKHLKTNFNGWNISQYTSNLIMRELRTNPNFTVRAARYNKSNLLKTFIDGNGAFSSKDKYMKELKAIASQQGYDTLLILEPMAPQVAVFRSYEVGEFGLFHGFGGLLFGDFMCVFVKYKLRLYSLQKNEFIGSTGDINLRYSHNGLPLCTKGEVDALSKTMVLTEQYKLRESLASYSDAEKNTMKQKIQGYISKGMRRHLKRLNLTQ